MFEFSGVGRPGTGEKFNRNLFSEKLTSDQLVEIKQANVISSTAIEVKWEVSDCVIHMVSYMIQVWHCMF